MRRLTLISVLVITLACSIPAGKVSPDVTRTPPVTSTPTSKPVVTSATQPPQTVDVTAFEALHVRAAPGYQSKVVDYLYVGEEVTLTGKCSEDPKGWAQIKWEKSTAWVNAKYLSKNKCSEK